MNLINIKNLLSSEEIAANQVNPIIDSLAAQDLDKLSGDKRKALYEMINNILLLSQDPSTGAHIDNPKKAESLLSALS